MQHEHKWDRRLQYQGCGVAGRRIGMMVGLVIEERYISLWRNIRLLYDQQQSNITWTTLECGRLYGSGGWQGRGYDLVLSSSI